MFTILAIATTLFLPPVQSPPTKGWALLDDASKRAVKYFIDQSDAKTGFTKDRAVNLTNVNDKDHVVASIAAIGFALSAYGIAAERGWMPREDAIERSILTLKSMRDIAPKHHGWFYHWINAETGAREWKSEVSTIDSAILWCGMILNDQALKNTEISKLNQEILSKIDWKYMRTNGDTKPEKLTTTMGWHDETGFINGEWNEYSENAMIYLLQLGFDKNSPDGTWTSFQRKQANAFGKMCLTGGPLFLHQMSQIFFDFKNKRDVLGIDYWENSRVVTLLQRQYGRTNPKKFKGYSDKQWGLSACDIPSGYGAQGFPGWGDDNGTLAPPAAIASVMFTRKESIEAAEEFMRLHPSSYGRYGFAGGINAHQNWIAPDAIGIDLGQMMLAIENARDGLPNKLFMQNPQVQLGMKRAGFRVTVEKSRPIIRNLSPTKNGG